MICPGWRTDASTKVLSWVGDLCSRVCILFIIMFAVLNTHLNYSYTDSNIPNRMEDKILQNQPLRYRVLMYSLSVDIVQYLVRFDIICTFNLDVIDKS